MIGTKEIISVTEDYRNSHKIDRIKSVNRMGFFSLKKALVIY